MEYAKPNARNRKDDEKLRIRIQKLVQAKSQSAAHNSQRKRPSSPARKASNSQPEKAAKEQTSKDDKPKLDRKEKQSNETNGIYHSQKQQPGGKNIPKIFGNRNDSTKGVSNMSEVKRKSANEQNQAVGRKREEEYVPSKKQRLEETRKEESEEEPEELEESNLDPESDADADAVSESAYSVTSLGQEDYPSSGDSFSGSAYSFSDFKSVDGNDEEAVQGNCHLGVRDEDENETAESEDAPYWTEDDVSFSDFDEFANEGEEESVSESSADDPQYSFNEQIQMDDFSGSETDDRDYHLPEGVLEDLVIHKGTAEKHQVTASDEIQFSDDIDEAQIIELPQEVSVKIIEQPKEFQRSFLEELSKRPIQLNPLPLEKKDDNLGSGTDCPQLVPVNDDANEVDASSNEGTSTDTSDSEEYTDEDGSDILIDDNGKHLSGSEDKLSTDDEGQKSSKKSTAETAEVIETDNDTPFRVRGCTNDKSYEQDESHNKIISEVLDTSTEFDRESHVKDKILEHRPTARKCGSSVKESKSPELGDVGTTDKINEIPTLASNINFRSVFCNSADSNHVLVLLREPIFLYGTVKLIPIAGSIETYGYTPDCGEELEIFSPRGLCSVHIAPKPNKEATQDALAAECQRLSTYFSKTELENMLEKFSPHENALILLKRNDQRKKLLNTLKKYMNENLFPNINAIPMQRPQHASECLVRCFINVATEAEKIFKPNPEWNQLQLQLNSRLMVIGGKSVGKSTMLRFLVNKYLVHNPRVLLIDLDIGQPELFVPQTISASIVSEPLIGPGFFLNHQPAMAFAIGHSNIVMCPHRYMLAVKELLRFCNANEEYAQIPWVVNTMGYNKGFGAELIAVLCEFLQPTDVVQLQSNKEINNFDYLMEPQIVAMIPRNIYLDQVYRADPTKPEADAPTYRLYVFNSAVLQESRYQRDWEMSAKDMRYAVMLSRLSEAFDSHAEWLADCKPLCASLDNLKVVSLLSNELTREQLLKSIEANLVYLCRLQDENLAQCFGIGVVRAIDYQLNQVYLVPAMPRECMSDVDCLVISEMPLPTSMLTDQGPKVKDTAPFVYTTADAMATKVVKQIYYRPAEFLTGKHNSIV